MGVVKVLFFAFFTLTCCEADDFTPQVLKRVISLEDKDAMQEARFLIMESKAKMLEEKFQRMAEANEMLSQTVKEQATELQNRVAVINELIADLNKKAIVVENILQTTRELTQDVASKTKTLEEIGILMAKQSLTTDSLERDARGSTQQNRILKSESKLTVETKSNKIHFKDLSLSGETSQFLSNMKRSPFQVTERKPSKKSINSVAFHAELSDLHVIHPAAGGSIVFPNVLLNDGNGYHSQHGLFIAPRAGLYLFSATLTSNWRDIVEIQASLIKNGQTLGRIYVHGVDSHHDQSSTVVVTHMNVGDEVWLRYDHPPTSAVWGNGFSVFTGILVAS